MVQYFRVSLHTYIRYARVMWFRSLRTSSICYRPSWKIDNPEQFCTFLTESDSLIFVLDYPEYAARFNTLLDLCSPESKCSHFMHEIFAHARFLLCRHSIFVHAQEIVCAHKFCAHTKIYYSILPESCKIYFTPTINTTSNLQCNNQPSAGKVIWQLTSSLS